jgi:DNA-cytosine methyltransferase
MDEKTTKQMNILSLFDGMSCGQQALERSNIKVNQYFASEIDKYAITVTMANYPNTIQLGSVIDVDGFKLPKIDLLIGGSPCQSFSFAGKRKGMSTKDEQEILTLEHYLELKAEGYEFEGQSYLFWEFMRLLNEVKPTYFLLENVMMGEKWERILSKAIGVKPVEINSSLLSAQNRRRLYWTNIGMQPMGLFGDLESIIQQPKDKGILLKDILESEVDEKYFISDVMVNRINRSNNSEKCFTTSDKSLCLAAGYYKQGRDNQYIVHNMMPRSGDPKKGGTGHLSRNDGKTYCLDTENTNAVEIVLTSKDKRLQKMVDNNVFVNGEIAHIDTYNQTIDKDKSPALKLPHNDRFIIAPTKSTNAVEIKAIMLGRSSNWGNPQKEDGKSYTLCKEQPHGIKSNSRIRRLTPIECERLQTVKDGYTAHVSDSQRYKMLGNGWTVDVIAHIFSYLK